ncbi:hypothetical protein L6R53_10320 [Myxococcota bacterium]|nr:hypothetical protein [Myxococcota bacterium]
MIPLLLLACAAPPECDADRPCAGFGELCVEGTCAVQGCATSAQCPMEQRCDAGECVAGCGEDTDCYPGEACDLATATCGPAACQDSHRDCAFQQLCDPDQGTCYDAEGYYCRSCDGDDDCGGNGNLCLSWSDNGDFCGVTCQTDVDCPSGYTCTVIPDDAGNPISSQCITWCWLYAEAG